MIAMILLFCICAHIRNYGTYFHTYQDEIPTHTMKIENLKGEWSPSNRNIALRLYDGYVAAQTLKKNLASEALKGYKLDSKSQTPSVSKKCFFLVM